MKRKKVGNAKFLLLLLFMFSIALLPFVMSLSIPTTSTDVVVDLKNYKQNTQLNLIRNCEYNGTFCLSNTICNSTVVDSNSVILINNLVETNNFTNYNLTIPRSKSGALGWYTQYRSCIQPGKGNGYEQIQFQVTPSGTNDNNIGYLLIMAFVFAFSVGTIIFGFAKAEAYVVILGSFVLVLLALFTLNNGVGNYRNSMTEWSSIITLLVGGYITIRSGLEAMDVL